MTRDDFDKFAQLAEQAKQAFVEWAAAREIKQPELYTLTAIDADELEFTRPITIRGWTEYEVATMPRAAFTDLTRERLSGLGS